MLIDTHCHLNRNEYDNVDEIIKKMNGIMITAGCDDNSNLEIIEQVNKYDNVYGVLGIHPESVTEVTEESFRIIEENLNNPKIVGIGEVGLDYYWDKTHIDEQKQLFIRQIELAQKYNKTVVVHSRDSIEDTLSIVKQYPDVKFVFHCFGSSLEIAKELVKRNIRLGIGGVVTFKNGVKLKEVVEGIDLEYLLLETDSPYLTPEPYRGKRNEPSNTLYVAQKIAEIKGIEVDKVIEKTAQNAIEQFDLPIAL